MAEVHKHKWEYHPESQLLRYCIICKLKQKKVRGEWKSLNWSIREN